MPKKFKFRLQVVLDHRRRIEEVKAGALGRATQSRLAAERLLSENLRAARDLLERQTQLQVSGCFLASDLEGHVVYLRSLQAEEKRRREEVARALDSESSARAELLAARQEREILDRLREKKLHAYVVELDRAETLLVDELATEGFSFRRRHH